MDDAQDLINEAPVYGDWFSVNQVNGNVNIISRTEYDSLRLYYSDYGSTGSHIFYKPSDIYVIKDAVGCVYLELSLIPKPYILGATAIFLLLVSKKNMSQFLVMII